MHGLKRDTESIKQTLQCRGFTHNTFLGLKHIQTPKELFLPEAARTLKMFMTNTNVYCSYLWVGFVCFFGLPRRCAVDGG